MTGTEIDVTRAPAFEGCHPLDPALVDVFAADGHVCVRGLASPDEAAAVHPVIEAAAIEHAWSRHTATESEDLRGAAQEVDRRAWLGGLPLGAVADHEMNPVISPAL